MSNPLFNHFDCLRSWKKPEKQFKLRKKFYLLENEKRLPLMMHYSVTCSLFIFNCSLVLILDLSVCCLRVVAVFQLTIFRWRSLSLRDDSKEEVFSRFFFLYLQLEGDIYGSLSGSYFYFGLLLWVACSKNTSVFSNCPLSV